jgi:hypothetical protein
LDGRAFSVLTIDGSADRIQAIYVVTNPEKLSHLQRDLPAPAAAGAP